MAATVYLIPSLLHEEGLQAIPSYIIEVAKHCQVFFVEEERTARRYLKKVDKEIIIDNYEWYPVSGSSRKPDTYDAIQIFKQKIKEEKVIGIISEAGCPGVADPGQHLVAIAHELDIEVKPLVGPSSLLLALMASGMNGQQFCFHGYLPVKDQERNKAIRELEAESAKKNCTQIFIETPYRNNQMIDALLNHCHPSTRICIASDLTGRAESVKTKSVADWKKSKPDIHKRLAIFLLYAGS